MNGSRSLQRLLARGLMLVAALMAVCAFHSATEPTDSPTAGLASSAVTMDLVGPLHLDPADVPSTSASADGHAHLALVSLSGLSTWLLLLGLVAGARCLATRRHRDPSVAGLASRLIDPLRPTTPSLIQLRVSRT